MAKATKAQMTKQGNRISNIENQSLQLQSFVKEINAYIDKEIQVAAAEISVAADRAVKTISDIERLAKTEEEKKLLEKLKKETEPKTKAWYEAKEGGITITDTQQHRLELAGLKLKTDETFLDLQAKRIEEISKQSRRQDATRIVSGIAAGMVTSIAYTQANTISARTGDDLAQREAQRRLALLSRGAGIGITALVVNPTTAAVAAGALLIQAGVQSYSSLQQINRNNQSAEARNFARGKMSYEGSR